MLANKSLLIVFSLALVMRLVSYVPFHSGGYTADEREYVYLAHKVAEGQQFIDSNGERSKRSPLYPILLGNLFRLFGDSLWLPHILGCVLGTIIILLGYRLSIHLWGDQSVALIASLAMTFYPGLMIYAGLLQTESLYMVFFLLALLFTYKMMEGGGNRSAILLGIVSGLAALTRAAFLGFFPILLFLVWWNQRQHAVRKSSPIVLALVFFVLVLTPWTLRNYALHGALIPVSTWGGQSLLIGNNPYATGTWSLKQGFNQWYKEEVARIGVADINSLSEVDVGSLDRTIAVDYIVSHPAHTLWLAAKKAYMFLVYPITNSDSYLPTQAVATAFDFLIYIGAAIGFVATWSERHRLLPVYGALVFFTFVQVMLHAEARYRLPLIPLLCIFFGWGVTVVANTQKRAELLAHGRMKTAAGVLVGLVGVVYVCTGLFFLTGKI
jgi:4-amino-4-deoxy-L-arabinose transferase-like glycosyltransferase